MLVLQEHAHGTPAFPVASYPLEYCTESDEFMFYPHYHDELEFFQLHSGDATVYVNTIPYTMHAGDFLVIPSAAIHSCKYINSKHCKTRVILCHPVFLCDRANDIVFTEYLQKLTSANSPALFFSSSASTASRASQLFQELTAAFELTPPAYELLVKAQLLELLHLAFTFSFPQPPQPAIDPAVSIIKKSLDYLNDHLQEDISLNTLAEQACLSPSHYGRLFKRIMACTPITYLLEKRITFARQLLSTTDMRISEIAMKAGFHNFSYFNRCFRHYQGMTPGEFRQQSQKKK